MKGLFRTNKPLICLFLQPNDSGYSASLFEFQVFSIKFSVMPTVLRTNGFRFFFYSNENEEPAHIHVEKGDAEGKIWLEPTVAASYLIGFTRAEENDVMKIVGSHFENFINQWYEYFRK